MNRRWRAVLLLLLLLTACGGSASTGTEQAASANGGAAASAPAAGDSSDESAVRETSNQGSAEGGTTGNTGSEAGTEQGTAPLGRMVIRNATLRLLVDTVDDAERSVRSLVQTAGGYLLESNTSGGDVNPSVRLVFKVPAERFDQMINDLEKLARKVQDRSITGTDVTEEFVDIESRLRNLRATEARLLEFLQEAKTVEEALLVNQQLTELQGQIEQASGRLTYLKENVAYSTVTVDLETEAPLIALDEPDTWRPGVRATRAWQSLLSFAQGLADIAIALAIWSPVWGLLAGAGWMIWRRTNRRNAPPPAPASPQP
jgi:hypothetical protein